MPERFEPRPPVPEGASAEAQESAEYKKDPELKAAMALLGDSIRVNVEKLQSTTSDAERTSVLRTISETTEMLKFLADADRHAQDALRTGAVGATGKTWSWRDNIAAVLSESERWEREAEGERDEDTAEKSRQQYALVEKYNKNFTPEQLKRHLS